MASPNLCKYTYYSNIFIYIYILWYYIYIYLSMFFNCVLYTFYLYYILYTVEYIYIYLYLYIYIYMIYIYFYWPHSSFRETSFHLRSTTLHRQLLRHIAMFSSLQPREASGTPKHGGIVGSLEDVVRKPSIWGLGYNCLVHMCRIMYFFLWVLGSACPVN